MAKINIQRKGNTPFSLALSRLMNKRNITQGVLAERIGKSRQAVSQYINGVSEPGYDTLVKIASFFNVSLDYLLGRMPLNIGDTVFVVIVDYPTDDVIVSAEEIVDTSLNSFFLSEGFPVGWEELGAGTYYASETDAESRAIIIRNTRIKKG